MLGSLLIMERKVIWVNICILIVSILLQLGTSDKVSNGSLIISNKEEKGVTGQCPSGWVISPNGFKCLKSINISKSWNDSDYHCKGFGGDLVAFTSTRELMFAQNLCSQIADDCWVGASTFNSSAGSWRWSNYSLQWNESFLNCSLSSCQLSKSVNLCALVAGNSTYLLAENCNTSHAFTCMIDAENRCSHMRCHREYLIVLAIVSGLILCIAFGVVIWLLAYRRIKKRRKSRKLYNPASSALVPPSWRVFTKEELKSITKSFSEGNRLPGDAKTGGTYSGVLPDGSKVAVKRLKRSSFQRKKEFFSEIGRAAKLHHPNLVAVKGCCYDHGDRYIVYEFIVHGPLDRWLHHIPRGGRGLDWGMRMKIATTLAQGIAFLHDKVKPQVVHRDIRASNVLLDEEFGAHLMGVGLSKFVPWEVLQERTMMAGGTHGYLAPEFVYKNELTTKSDVYSFGVLLLEIVSGRRPTQAVDSVGLQSIFEWATPIMQANRYLELLDPLISSSSSNIPEFASVQKVVDLVYSCTEHVPSMRPRMSHVVHQLQQLSEPLPMN